MAATIGEISGTPEVIAEDTDLIGHLVLKRNVRQIVGPIVNRSGRTSVLVTSGGNFPIGPCRTLSWTRFLSPVGVQHDPPGSLRQHSFRHRATAADVALSRERAKRG